MDAGQEMRALSRTSNLSDEAQDWGIANSDAFAILGDHPILRVGGTHPRPTIGNRPSWCSPRPTTHWKLVAATTWKAGLARFLARDLHGLNFQVRYWSSLQSEEEFPIAHLLRQWLAHA